MISIFDLRANPDPETFAAIAILYDEQPRCKVISPAKIKACIGCWSCWVKTPGVCICKDALLLGVVSRLSERCASFQTRVHGARRQEALCNSPAPGS